MTKMIASAQKSSEVDKKEEEQEEEEEEKEQMAPPPKNKSDLEVSSARLAQSCSQMAFGGERGATATVIVVIGVLLTNAVDDVAVEDSIAVDVVVDIAVVVIVVAALATVISELSSG